MSGTPTLDPPLCSDLNADQRKALQAIYHAWTKDIRWPRTQWIDIALDREHSVDLEKVLPTIPERYAIYNRFAPGDSELKLTVAGIRCCDASDADVALFMLLVRWCVEHERAFQPSDPTQRESLQLASKDAAEEWTRLGADVAPEILAKAFSLGEVEQIHSGWQRSGDSPDWTITITRSIRPYRDAQTFEQYLAVKEERFREARAQVPRFEAQKRSIRSVLSRSGVPFVGVAVDALGPTSLFSVSVDDGDDDLAMPVLGVDHLHPLLADACRGRFGRGLYREGVLAAFYAFRDLVRERSGLNDEDDSTLMGKAFGGKSPALVIADRKGDTGRNRQRGMAHLSQGLIAFVRNPLTHNTREVEPITAMRMVGIVDLLVRCVDEWPSASTPPDADLERA